MTIAFFATPESAEYAFYSAIEGIDLEAMMAVWEPSATIICIHPMGPRLQGTHQVRESWQRIFSSGVRLRFRIDGVHNMCQSDLAVRTVYEYITVLGAEEQPVQPIIATNIYRYHARSWRMVVHHASPGPSMGASQRGSAEQLH